MEQVAREELGTDWRSHFQRFDDKPFAAASIGQVHRAVTRKGESVAVKIQYPGISDTIESDLKNLQSLLTYTGLLPKGMYLEQAIEVAKRELKWEVDYVREAACTERFRKLLEKHSNAFHVPTVIRPLSTARVLTTEFLSGISLDRLDYLEQSQKDLIAERMLRLCMRELFEFRFMQTDPNWSNFLFDAASGTLQLLDFGASRDYDEAFTDKYLRVIEAAVAGDRDACLAWSIKLGFLTGEESPVRAILMVVFALLTSLFRK